MESRNLFKEFNVIYFCEPCIFSLASSTRWRMGQAGRKDRQVQNGAVLRRGGLDVCSGAPKQQLGGGCVQGLEGGSVRPSRLHTIRHACGGRGTGGPEVDQELRQRARP
jgi:hypothetical protein